MLDFCVLYSVFNVHFNSILNTRQSEAIVVLSQPSFRTVSPIYFPDYYIEKRYKHIKSYICSDEPIHTIYGRKHLRNYSSNSNWLFQKQAYCQHSYRVEHGLKSHLKTRRDLKLLFAHEIASYKYKACYAQFPTQSQ